MTADPNMRCTCGHRRFRETIEVSTLTPSVWAPMSGGGGGFGSTPLGTFLGGGDIEGYGRYILEQKRTTKSTFCESCRRLRKTVVLGGLGVFGATRFGDLVVVGVTSTQNLGCLTIEFRGTNTSISRGVTPYTGSPPELTPPSLPVEVESSLPPGAPVLYYLTATVPEVFESNLFDVYLVDRCSNTETLLLSALFLETQMQNLIPSDADLSGINDVILTKALRAQLYPNQPSSGALRGIAFDKCDGVLEYDVRFGGIPSAQGWTHQGTGLPTNYAVAAGGALAMQTTTDDSFWEKSLTLASAPTQVYSYAQYMVDSSNTGTAEGLVVAAEGTPGAADYWGTRLTARATELVATELLGGSDLTLSTTSPTWRTLFSGLADTGVYGQVLSDDTIVEVDAAADWGTGDPGPADPTLRARFGDLAGSVVVGRLRNVVVSAGGLFVRAFFRAFAPSAAPIIRLYVVSDADSSGGTTARFRVRFGNQGPGSDPHSFGNQTVDTTVSCATRNTVIEVPITLSGLSAGAPFWFTLERVWDHVDDTTRASIHLVQCTVRNQ